MSTRRDRIEMFFLRCAFWLMIVYASMSWPTGTFEPAPRSSALLESLASHLVGASDASSTALFSATAEKLGDLCSHHRVECLADAARLTALIETADPTDRAAPEARTAQVVPMPVPDPRRAGRGVKLRDGD